MEEFQYLNVQLLLNYFMLLYIQKCLLFGLRKVKTNGNIYVYFEIVFVSRKKKIVLYGLAFNLRPPYGTFNFIASCPFLFVLNIQSLAKTTS